MKSAEERLKSAEAELQPLLLQVPQPPDEDVPVGKDAGENVVAYKWGEPRKFDFEPRSHIELGAALGILDFPAGVRIAGSRSYFLKGAAAELHQAVLRLATDLMVYEKGFTQLTVPVLVREKAMLGTGFFPGGREQAYRVGEREETGEDVRFLTGTAEVALTAYVMPEGSEVDADRGGPAAEVHGRQHLLPPGGGGGGQGHRRPLPRPPVRQVRAGGHLPQRRRGVRALAQGDARLQRGDAPAARPPVPRDPVLHRRPGREERRHVRRGNLDAQPRAAGPSPTRGYGETHSASRLYEFQARRLNLRYKDKDGKIRFCHTLNNTVVASPRILIPILENYQNADGSVTVPEVLRKYVNGRERIGGSV